MDFETVVAKAKGAMTVQVRWSGCECCGYEAGMVKDTMTAAVAIAKEALAEGGRIRVRKDRAMVTDPRNRGEWGGRAAAVFFF